MKVKYIGESDPLALLNGKEYEVTEISPQMGWYRVIDETDEDYLYPPDVFEVVEEDEKLEELESPSPVDGGVSLLRDFILSKQNNE